MALEREIRPYVAALRLGATPVELELRLGRGSTGHFDASVTKETMDVVLRAVAEGADDSLEWYETHDFFYPHGGQTIRTTVEFDDLDFCLNTTHVIKRRISATDTATYRVACATETPVNGQTLPFSIQPHHVRIKQRRSVHIAALDLETPLWRYDFTMVWAGDTQQSAERSQRSAPPRYEVEVEVLPAAARELLARLRATPTPGEAPDETLVAYLEHRIHEIAHGLGQLTQ